MPNIYYKMIFCLLIIIHVVNSSILLWGPKQVQFPALREFTNKNFDDLLKKIKSTQVVAFESKVIETANSINLLITNKTTAYIPRSNINFENLKVSELTGNQTDDLRTIQNVLDESEIHGYENSIVALIINDPVTEMESHGTPVLFSVSPPLNQNIETMVFSSRPLLLKTNTSSISLGEPILITTDTRETVTRVVAWIPIEDGKIILRFKFAWLNDYWHFATIEVQFVTNDDLKQFTLVPYQDIKAPRHLSYHCRGETIFSDQENDIKLYFFDLQAQPDVEYHQFGEIYGCVNTRIKRKVEDESSSTTQTAIATTDIPYVKPSGDFVIYNATLPTDKDIEAMIYSSSSPLLKIGSFSTHLGDATVSRVDIRDTYTRLIATILVESGKITLRFKFPWLNGYWSLTSVEVESIVGATTKQYNLTINNQDISAPRRFSYHCGSHVVFVDPENEVELYLFEVQAQPDAKRHRFSDAYNCVPFTTGPLWSGLFVAFILVAGLIVGLTALDNIKTMDKFDNHKTKQLSITVCE